MGRRLGRGQGLPALSETDALKATSPKLERLLLMGGCNKLVLGLKLLGGAYEW